MMTEMTNEQKKKCHTCKQILPLVNFYNAKGSKDGLYSSCKLCTDKRTNLYRKQNPLLVREIGNRSSKKWYKSNSKIVNKNAMLWAKNNREIVRKANKKWQDDNPEKMKQHRQKSALKIRQTPKGKLKSNMTTAIWKTLKLDKNNRMWTDLVGYTVIQLKAHLENKFQPGMTWENYGKYGWHIDHIIPIAAFNFETAEDIDFKKCWSLSNLQPLWAKDNIMKRDKIDKPFQPSLSIGVING